MVELLVLDPALASNAVVTIVGVISEMCGLSSGNPDIAGAIVDMPGPRPRRAVGW